MKPNYSFRLDPKLMEMAKVKGMQMPLLIEQMIIKELKLNVCSKCGAKKVRK
jgi:hypothetical protein